MNVARAETGLQTALPADLDADLRAALEEWQAAHKVSRLWAGDATLWTGAGEHEWLGWLDAPRAQLARVGELRRIADDARAAELSHALLMGMGGSSLAPEVLAEAFGQVDGHLRLRVLDSTDPAQVSAAERAIDLARTLFIVSSKSGSTLEPNVLREYFFSRAAATLGRAEARRRFVAITDPGSPLERIARREGLRAVLRGAPSIGGRYSALSDFGLAPAALAGVDVAELLERAQRAAQMCAPRVAAADNPGLVLGLVLGVCCAAGRDKLTLVVSPAIAALGAWLEQLVAESTGKDGKGIIPVDGEPLGGPDVYGQDRLFAYVRLRSEPDDEQDTAVDTLEQAGQPVVRIDVGDRLDLGAQFFQWQFATAVAGAVLRVNPFDQPDVEDSKKRTLELTAEYERTGSLPEEEPLHEEAGLRLFADERNAAALGSHASLDGFIGGHLGRAGERDYVALLAYLPRTFEYAQSLAQIRALVRDRTGAATCVGFGPRFLHSTGQVYKGGPNSGVFLQITCDDQTDLEVPGRGYTFGVVKAAQARADLDVLTARGRRVLRVHLGADVECGLRALGDAVTRALSA
jgi:transaldolase/glucose-6-phosphate isomerase